MARRHRTPEAAGPDDGPPTSPGADDLGRERWELLRQIDALLDGPMVALSFVWLGLTIVVQGLTLPFVIQRAGVARDD